MDDQAKKLRFEYVLPEGYNPVIVNGAHGGVTPRGEIVMHLYFEHQNLPEIIEHELQPDGRLGPMSVPAAQYDKPAFQRVVTGGAVMSVKSATEIRDWLTRQIEAAKQGAEMAGQQSSESGGVRQ